MTRLSNLFSAATLTLCAIAAIPATSALAQDHSHHGPATATTEHAIELASGEIVKVDKDAAKLTIKHGPLANLKMPGMTMAFKVKNSAMLDQVQAGDKVSFYIEKIAGALTVTTLEAAK